MQHLIATRAEEHPHTQRALSSILLTALVEEDPITLALVDSECQAYGRHDPYAPSLAFGVTDRIAIGIANNIGQPFGAFAARLVDRDGDAVLRETVGPEDIVAMSWLAGRELELLMPTLVEHRASDVMVSLFRAGAMLYDEPKERTEESLQLGVMKLVHGVMMGSAPHIATRKSIERRLHDAARCHRARFGRSYAMWRQALEIVQHRLGVAAVQPNAPGALAVKVCGYHCDTM